MIPLDASAGPFELSLNTPRWSKWCACVGSGGGLYVPHLVDVEVAQALRRYVREGQLATEDAAAALDALRDLHLTRHAHEPLLDRVWSLRDNFSAYDAGGLCRAG